MWWLVVIGALALMVGPAAGTVFENAADSAWRLNSTGEARVVASTATHVYVGGDFATIDDGVGGAPVGQSFLAAFDQATGDYDAAFAPQLNGVVHALATTLDGTRLFVGGSFSMVNGVAFDGLAELDPATGATISLIEAGTAGTVYDLHVEGNWLYVVGNLTWVGAVQVSGAGRVDLTTGLADPAWTPTLTSGSVRAVTATAGGGPVYLGGFFNAVNGSSTDAKLVAVDDMSGATDPFFDPGHAEEVFDLALTVDKLYIAHGGPGGRGDIRDPRSGTLLRSHMTDGDVQAVEVSGSHVYFGHHGEIVNGAPQAWVFAVDRASDDVDPAFAPVLTCTAGVGVWAVHDAGGHLWVGGGITSASPVDGRGVVRLPAADPQPTDVTAPTAPSGLNAPIVGDQLVQLNWSPSLDDSGSVYYRVWRDGALVGTAPDTQFLDMTVAAATTVSYVVEVVDAAQNATSSSPLPVTTLPTLSELVAFDLGHTWSYLDNAVAPVGWTQPGFNDAPWESGPAQLGRGDGDEATVVDHPAQPSVTVYLRTEFVIPAGTTAITATFDYLRDDGVVVRVNGTEVLRDNLPQGPIDETTRALTWISAEENTVISTAIDASTFVEGTNAVTVELHNVSHGSDLSFDAALRLGVSTDTVPPTVPGALQADDIASTTVDLSWTASTDDVAVVGYDVLRDGIVVGTTPVAAFQDSSLSPSTAYAYEVRARDAVGNTSGLTAPLLVTTDDPVPDVTPPLTPTGVAAPIVTQTSIVLTWSASVDDVGVAGYEVWRDGVLVGTVTGNTHVDNGLTPSTSFDYVVVAYDAVGNRSGDSAVLSVVTADPEPQVVEVLPFGSTWSYLDTGSYPGSTWTLSSFDDAGWPSGPAELGVNDGGEVTVVAPRPTVWMRSTFTVADPAAIEAFDLELVADDGAVVFVNGIEVIRDNVGPGPVDGSTAALSYRWGAAETVVRTFAVPPGVLTGGTNTIAVAVINAPGSSDMSFDLRAELLVGVGGAPDVMPPSQPAGLVATNVSSTSLQLSWVASTDDIAVAGYDVFRDGVFLATVTGTVLADSGLVADTSYSYEVEAFDAAGNRSTRSAPLVVTTASAPPVESDLLPMGSTWRYLDTGAYPGASWVQPSFVDGSWAQGAAPLAAVDPGVTALTNQPTVWLRSTVNVADSSAVVALEADVRADDGVVVFINGVEVLRDNVGAGPVDGSTPASSYRWGSVETEVRTFVLPVGDLVDGDNVIAAALVNGNGSSDSSFDLALRQFVQN